MSFVGYKNEIASDEDMLQLLRFHAISNFGANPADLLAESHKHESPYQEALDKILTKMKPEDLLKKLMKLEGE